MKIALDATPLIEPTGGVPRYTVELAKALAESSEDDEVWLLSDQPFPNPGLPGVQCGEPPTGPLNRRWWAYGLPSQLSRLRVDVFHGTGFAVPYVPIRPSVLSLHDVSPWLRPEWHFAADRVRRRTPLVIKLGLATLVLTPSEAIRREAIERFRISPGRIFAVPHAASSLFRPVQVAPTPNPYFLFVGTLEPRKNVGLLLQAWREVRRSHSVDLVLAGRRRDDFPEIAPEPGLRLLGAVPDQCLPELYSGCLACLYPSLYEGFGLPVLEAMQCGVAVLTSRDPAILETAGGAAVALDVTDSRGWVEALTSFVENPVLAPMFRERSLRRAREFSWSRTAALTREVYVEAARRFHR